MRFNLKIEDRQNLSLNSSYIESFKEDILKFLDGQDYMKNVKFAKKMMMSQEIKSNNNIEGIVDDLSIIDEVIKKKSNLTKEERQRIINLYHGYRYILQNKEINKENLRELYSILSKDILDEYSIENMGQYYREQPVYILRDNLSLDPYMGMDSDKLDYFMEGYFDFANSDILTDSELNLFIKSQIMHFYFVYIHPYFDVNGRTSRTVSMWHLLNNEDYPYIIFNRAIAFARNKYEKNIITTRESGDITLFIKYMLVNVLKEFEKEYVIQSVKNNSPYSINAVEEQTIEYMLSMNGNLTAKDLGVIYNSYNDHKRYNIIFKEKIKPLLEKNIFVNNGEVKSYIDNDQHNINLRLNKDLIDIDKNKIKYLKLDKYIK